MNHLFNLGNVCVNLGHGENTNRLLIGAKMDQMLSVTTTLGKMFRVGTQFTFFPINYPIFITHHVSNKLFAETFLTFSGSGVGYYDYKPMIET